MISKAQNISNLTGLWKLAGEKAGFYKQFGAVHLSLVIPGQWPNKIWVEGEISLATLAKVSWLAFGKSLRLAIWDKVALDTLGAISEIGLEKGAELIGMSLDCTQLPDFKTKVELVPISGVEDAKRWSDLFHSSFGYQLLPGTLMNIKDQVDFFLAKVQDMVFGTCMVYIDSAGVAGIYSFGIIPRFRGKQLAGPFLEAILQFIQRKKSNKVILQASEMGLGVYLKYGFKEDFSIQFYQLKQ